MFSVYLARERERGGLVCPDDNLPTSASFPPRLLNAQSNCRYLGNELCGGISVLAQTKGKSPVQTFPVGDADSVYVLFPPSITLITGL